MTGENEVKGLSGIINLGNTCYLNSATQCLMHTPNLNEYFLTEKYLKDLNHEKKEGKMVIEYGKLIKGLWEDNCIVKPISFRNTFGQLNPKFQGNQQQDAQEALSILLDMLHMGLSYQAEIGYNGTPKTDIDKMTVDAIKSWSENFKKEYSSILDVFFGQFHNILKCKKCGDLTHNYDPFSVLTLPIVGGNIYDCLDDFCRVENLDTNNQWECEKCKQKSDAYKTMLFWKLPKILIIAFKRFSFNNVYSRKINNLIEFPFDELDMGKYVNGYDKYHGKYELYAMINHSGGLGGGHYYAYCKNMENRKWYEYNDASVDEVKNMVMNNAYVLFYKLHPKN